jgi:integrase
VKSIEIKPISDITTRDVSEAMLKLPSSLSNATVNRYKAAISVVFNYACRQYNLTSNPVGLIPSKPEDNHRVRYLSTLERKRLLNACREVSWSKLYLLVLTAITTGARRGELLSLRWNDIDFERQTAYVQTTKNGQPKVLPLTDDVIKELNKFRQQGSSLIFNSEIKPDKAFCFNKQWKKALTLAEVDNFRFHDLRHTTASYLAMSGASLLEIADVLGHKQISVTKRYAHLCIDHKERLISRVFSKL